MAAMTRLYLTAFLLLTSAEVLSRDNATVTTADGSAIGVTKIHLFALGQTTYSGAPGTTIFVDRQNFSHKLEIAVRDRRESISLKLIKRIDWVSGSAVLTLRNGIVLSGVVDTAPPLAGYEEVSRKLIKFNWEQDPPRSVEFHPVCGFEPLIRAILRSCVQRVREYVDDSVPQRIKKIETEHFELQRATPAEFYGDWAGMTPIHAAIVAGNATVLEMLVGWHGGAYRHHHTDLPTTAQVEKFHWERHEGNLQNALRDTYLDAMRWPRPASEVELLYDQFTPWWQRAWHALTGTDPYIPMATISARELAEAYGFDDAIEHLRRFE